MKSLKSNNETSLLPNYFKKIGLVIIVVSLIHLVLVKTMHLNLSAVNKEIVRVVTLNAFILGLLLLAWSRDKVEDEMTIGIRLKAMGWAFIWAVLVVIIKPVIDLIFGDPIFEMKAPQLVLSMLFVFVLMYYILKRSR